MRTIWGLKELPLRWNKEENTSLAGRYLLSSDKDIPLWNFSYISDISYFQVIYAGAVLLQMSERTERRPPPPPSPLYLQNTQTPFSWSSGSGSSSSSSSSSGRKTTGKGRVGASASTGPVLSSLNDNTMMDEHARNAIRSYVEGELQQLTSASSVNRESADHRLRSFWKDVSNTKLCYDAQVLDV